MKLQRPEPKFKIGDKVHEIQRPEIVGIIDCIFWHFKDNEYKFHININEKRKSKRYLESELQSVYFQN